MMSEQVLMERAGEDAWDAARAAGLARIDGAAEELRRLLDGAVDLLDSVRDAVPAGLLANGTFDRLLAMRRDLDQIRHERSSDLVRLARVTRG